MEKETQIASKHSLALQEILKESSVDEFFTQTWQNKPLISRSSSNVVDNDDSPSLGGDGFWDETRMQTSLLKELKWQRWHILQNTLFNAEEMQSSPNQEMPLIFRNRELQDREEVEQLYGSSLYAPYLNGCSVVLNHADLLSPWVAALCLDLQKSFPHAYANCYITPPNSQAVPPHADDRDVLVIQLVGSKNWKVYKDVPVKYPYPKEQVGKQGIPVPANILEGPMEIETTLYPGDVLYMPRGFVHQASCGQSLSCHITVALATHDWSLAGAMSMATESILTRSIDNRKSIIPFPLSSSTGEKSDGIKALQIQIDKALEEFRDQITAETILSTLDRRVQQHNERALPLRMQLIEAARRQSQAKVSCFNNTLIGRPSNGNLGIGPTAAKFVSYDTWIRAATAEERASVVVEATSRRGLHVRDEIADAISNIVACLKADMSIVCRVVDLRSKLTKGSDVTPLLCDLAILSLAKRAVELSAFCVVSKPLN